MAVIRSAPNGQSLRLQRLAALIGRETEHLLETSGRLFALDKAQLA